MQLRGELPRESQSIGGPGNRGVPAGIVSGSADLGGVLTNSRGICPMADKALDETVTKGGCDGRWTR